MGANIDLDSVISHICSRSAWEEAQMVGFYEAESLKVEGFIHCSRPEQILKVANLYFPEVTDLVLLWIDLQALTADLRWELSDGGVFPHLYGLLNLAAVIGVSDLVPDSDGIFRQLPFPGEWLQP